MLSLPAEILLEIGKTGLETYKGMLAVPKFARAITIGYRLDIMERCKYNYRNIITRPTAHIRAVLGDRKAGLIDLIRGCDRECKGYLFINDRYNFMYFSNAMTESKSCMCYNYGSRILYCHTHRIDHIGTTCSYTIR